MKNNIVNPFFNIPDDHERLTFHVFSVPHNPTHSDFSCCAFAQKARKLCWMLKSVGNKVYHYGNELSIDTEHIEKGVICDEHINVTTEETADGGVSELPRRIRACGLYEPGEPRCHKVYERPVYFEYGVPSQETPQKGRLFLLCCADNPKRTLSKPCRCGFACPPYRIRYRLYGCVSALQDIRESSDPVLALRDTMRVISTVIVNSARKKKTAILTIQIRISLCIAVPQLRRGNSKLILCR